MRDVRTLGASRTSAIGASAGNQIGDVTFKARLRSVLKLEARYNLARLHCILNGDMPGSASWVTL
jgi:hypothetical protein